MYKLVIGRFWQSNTQRMRTPTPPRTHERVANEEDNLDNDQPSTSGQSHSNTPNQSYPVPSRLRTTHLTETERPAHWNLPTPTTHMETNTTTNPEHRSISHPASASADNHNTEEHPDQSMQKYTDSEINSDKAIMQIDTRRARL